MGISRRNFLSKAKDLAFAAAAAKYTIGCATLPAAKPLAPEELHQFGNFNPSRPSREGLEGIAIGAPYGDYDGISHEAAIRLSELTGAGLVVADGFKRKHGFNVTHPTRGDTGLYRDLTRDAQSSGVHMAYRQKLEAMARTPVSFYAEIRRDTGARDDTVEIQTSGISRDEASLMKKIYEAVAKKHIPNGSIKPVRIEPTDELKTDSWGTKHVGTLLYVPKGVIIAMPLDINGQQREAYLRILSILLRESIPILKNGVASNGEPVRQIRSVMHSLGRFDYIDGVSPQFQGVVLGAPHGSADHPTAEIVRDASFATGIAAVIARGFTRFTTGDYRINTNRPTEGAYSTADKETHSSRAREVYNHFESLVLKMAGRKLDTYFDVHTSAPLGHQGKMEVATTGISGNQATKIREILKTSVDKYARELGVPRINVLVEPADHIVWQAYGAKTWGILRHPRIGFHLEFPQVGYPQERVWYTKSLTEAVPPIVQLFR